MIKRWYIIGVKAKKSLHESHSPPLRFFRSGDLPCPGKVVAFLMTTFFCYRRRCFAVVARLVERLFLCAAEATAESFVYNAERKILYRNGENLIFFLEIIDKICQCDIIKTLNQLNSRKLCGYLFREEPLSAYTFYGNLKKSKLR